MGWPSIISFFGVILKSFSDWVQIGNRESAMIPKSPVVTVVMSLWVKTLNRTIKERGRRVSVQSAGLAAHCRIHLNREWSFSLTIFKTLS